MQFTLGDFTRVDHRYSGLRNLYLCVDTCVFVALLFNACITLDVLSVAIANSLNVSNFMKCQHKHHTLTIT